jgi:hypothetical protein
LHKKKLSQICKNDGTTRKVPRLTVSVLARFEQCGNLLELVSKFDSASKEALTLDSQAGLEFSYETHRPAVGQNEEFIAAGKEETPAGPTCSRRSSLC